MTSEVDVSRLQALVDAKVGPGEPGLAVGVCRNGELVETAVAGLADAERGVPIGPDTVFDIASSSKQITATTVLLLARDGVLSLDDELSKHVPEVRLRPSVTIRQCLQHTAGLREYFSLSGLVGAGPDSWKRESDVMRALAGQLDTDFSPQTDWSYSNTGYIAAAAVVRAVTGKSLAEVARERIFEPLGMSATRFQEDAQSLVPNRATGHLKAGEAFQRADSYDEVIGDGAVLTTLADAARWLAFVADGRVLGTDVRDQLVTRARLADGTDIPYCLGIERQEVAGVEVAGHGGAIEGYRAHLLAALDGSGYGAVVLTNRSDIRPHLIAEAALVSAMGGETAAAAETPLGDPSPDEDVLGLWFNPRERVVLAVTRSDNGLQVGFGPTSLDITPAGPGRWAVTMFDDVQLVREGDGLVLDLGAHEWQRDVMERVDGGDGERPPVGVYLSPELNAIAVIEATEDGLTWRCGANEPSPLTPLSVPETWRLPTGVVTVSRDAGGDVVELAVSASRMRGVRFVPYDANAGVEAGIAVGFPIPFGGPRLPAELLPQH